MTTRREELAKRIAELPVHNDYQTERVGADSDYKRLHTALAGEVIAALLDGMGESADTKELRAYVETHQSMQQPGFAEAVERAADTIDALREQVVELEQVRDTQAEVEMKLDAENAVLRPERDEWQQRAMLAAKALGAAITENARLRNGLAIIKATPKSAFIHDVRWGDVQNVCDAALAEGKEASGD